jgi:hypothetical protein
MRFFRCAGNFLTVSPVLTSAGTTIRIALCPNCHLVCTVAMLDLVVTCAKPEMLNAVK